MSINLLNFTLCLVLEFLEIIEGLVSVPECVKRFLYISMDRFVSHDRSPSNGGLCEAGGRGV